MKLSESDTQTMDELMEHIRQNALSIQGVPELADHVHFSVSKLNKLFKVHAGEGPAGYLRKQKMVHAQQLHEQGGASWTEIAYSLGYADLASFSKAYKRNFGCSPTNRKS